MKDDYLIARYDDLLMPFNRLAIEIMDDLPMEKDQWLHAWKEYVNSLNDICFLFFPEERK